MTSIEDDPPNNGWLRVRGTQTRVDAKSDYVVRINARMKRQLRLGSMCAIIHDKNILLPGMDTPVPRRFIVPARVAVAPSSRENAYAVSDGEAELDKSLRTALGISFDLVVGREAFHHPNYVYLCPLKASLRWRLGERISRIFGRRLMFLRINAAFPNDMEKHLAKISSHNLQILGTCSGDVLKLDAVVADHSGTFKIQSIRLQTYEVDPVDLNDRAQIEKAKTYVNYVDAHHALQVPQDVGRIFIDAEARAALGANILAPVRVRRSIRHALMKETVDFGLLFGLSSLALFQAVPSFTQLSFAGALGLFAVCICLSMVMVGYRIRARIHTSTRRRN